MPEFLHGRKQIVMKNHKDKETIMDGLYVKTDEYTEQVEGGVKLRTVVYSLNKPKTKE